MSFAPATAGALGTSETRRVKFRRKCMHGGGISAPGLQNWRLILGAFPWKFGGGEAAFCRAVAFDGEWPKEV